MSIALSSRPPLEPTTNDIHRPVLRHKSSHLALQPNLDSSEDYPSAHSSIYEASLIQANASSEHVDEWDTPKRAESTEGPPSWENIVVNDAGEGVPISFLQPFSTKKTHTPHELYPITEQSSFATLRPADSFIMKGRPSTSTLRSRSPGLNGKKRKSFSLSDVPPAPKEEPAQKSPPPSPLPRPVRPYQAPPERMPTPPGLPAFNKPEAIDYRLPPPNSHRRDNWLSPSSAELEYRSQTIGLPKGVVMRGPDGILIRGKFTPIRSGHLPPMPVNRDTILQLPGQYSYATEPREREMNVESVRASTRCESSDRIMTLMQLEGERRKERTLSRSRRIHVFIDCLSCCGICGKGDVRGDLPAREIGSLEGVAESPRMRPLFVGGSNERCRQSLRGRWEDSGEMRHFFCSER